MAPGIKTLAVDGLRVEVERKAIRNLYLRIGPEGTVRVTAPRAVTDGQVEAFVRSKRRWLDQRLRALPTYRPRYVAGERFPLWGKWYPLAVEETTGRPSAHWKEGQIVLRVEPGAEEARRKAVLDAFYRRELAAALPAVVERQEARTGLHASSWQIREMSTRWGSCTVRTGAIRVNLHLAKFPPECLAYLVTHELTHLLEAGHNARFYGFLDRFYPNWRQARACLRAGAPVLPPEGWSGT